MRERVFAVLGGRVIDVRLLDLYAGTGAVGLEALSRGARSVVFVERHRAAVDLIEQNLGAFDLTNDRAELLARPASAAVDHLARRGDHFDIAWADPPFESWRDGLEVLVELFEIGLLSKNSLACLECPERADVAGSLPAEFEITRDLVGGASRVVMIERSKD
jgi:16S rRNA (guanine(966)-N(2))-methyltransferase RsmD